MTRNAIIVGIDAYNTAPLQGCRRDAEEIAECLILEQYDFDCQVFLDKSATRGNLLQALGEKAYLDADGQVLLIYFAGHGQVLGNHGHLVAVDGTAYDPGISLSHLGQLMESASSRYSHVIAILDCCHAGSAIQWVSSRPLQPRDINRDVQTVNESRCILAACRPEQSAYEDGTHGYFTSAVLDGLLGGAVDFDGNVSAFTLYEHITQALPSKTQTPVFKGDVAGTVILGTGFTPREGRQIGENELKRVLAKARGLVDEYYHLKQRETADREYFIREGARILTDALAPNVNWLKDTEVALPDVKRNPDWVALRERMREFQADLASITVGQTFRFGTVARHLGHGGYGHVWLIEDRDGPDLALKVFHGNELDDMTKVQRFQNGYGNMRKLDHPRIVRVHELIEAPYGFLMDAVPGENLRNVFLDRENPEVCLRLLIDIAETVLHAHSRGVKHRDIKPENIIVVLSEYGELTPYLTDFDLAYHETNRTVTTNLGVGGVINYAAPEQLYMPNAAASRAETVDVFSLAQLMFFVVVGRDPAGDDFNKNAELLTRSLNDWVEGRAAEELLKFYVLATKKDSSDRPQDIRECIAFLSRAEGYVLAASGRDDIPEGEFCSRLGHLYAGVGQYRATEDSAHLVSLSQQVEIIVRNKGLSSKSSDAVDLEVEFSVTDNIPVSVLSSSASARIAVNSRLDKLLRRYDGVSRHAGSKGLFQTFINMRRVPLNLRGLSRTDEVLRTVVSGIEHW